MHTFILDITIGNETLKAIEIECRKQNETPLAYINRAVRHTLADLTTIKKFENEMIEPLIPSWVPPDLKKFYKTLLLYYDEAEVASLMRKLK